MAGKYEEIINASRDFITLVNRDYRYEFVNDAYCRELGRPRGEILGRSVAQLWGEEKFQAKIKKYLDLAFAGGESHDIDRFIWGEGYKYIHVAYFPYFEDGAVTSVVIYSHDISVIKGLESRLIDYEFRDGVTGLFNRKSFDIVLDMELEKAKRSPNEKNRVLLAVHLRNLGEVNIQYGHRVGDLILESSGIRIKETLRASDLVFRFDGNEFIAILTGIRDLSDIATVAEKVWERISLPYPNQDATINMGCNIGVAVYPDDGLDREALLHNALSALGEARATDQHFLIQNQDLHQLSLAKFRTKVNIRKALVDEQFELRYQPIVDASGAIRGAEALIRWNHPDTGYIAPSYFIPIAEEAGDVLMIGRWLLFQVCSHLTEWADVLDGRYVSINLSAREFDNERLVPEFTAIMDQFVQLERSSIKVEITETQSVTNIESTTAKIEQFAAAGIGVFIDDFGAGYSSLGYLKALPAELIKIDKVFVDTIAEHPEDMRFLQTLVQLIVGRRKKVLVEGVETKRQLDLLADIPELRLQGYYFSKPLSPEAFGALLRSGARLPSAEPA